MTNKQKSANSTRLIICMEVIKKIQKNIKKSKLSENQTQNKI